MSGNFNTVEMTACFMTVSSSLEKEKLMIQERKGRLAQARYLNGKGELAFDKSMNSSSVKIDRSQNVWVRDEQVHTRGLLWLIQPC